MKKHTMTDSERKLIDISSYIQQIRTGPCFICEFIAGNPRYFHHKVFENDTTIAFLDKYPTLAGHVLVAPKKHLEHVIFHFSLDQYLAMERLVYRIGIAIRKTIPTERLYIYSLGSQQGNSHVHWHIAPLPPGVSYEKQQFATLMFENGILNISDEEMASIALKIQKKIKN